MGDAQIVRSLLQRVDMPGLEIKHIDRIHDALSYLRHTPVDMIFLDVELPDSAAIRFDIAYLRRCTRAPIVLVTGLPKSALTDFLERHPSLGYLNKADLSTQALLDAIPAHVRPTDEPAVPIESFDIDFERLIDSMSGPVFLLDKTGQIIWHNASGGRVVNTIDAVQRRIRRAGSIPSEFHIDQAPDGPVIARIDAFSGARMDGLFVVTLSPA